MSFAPLAGLYGMVLFLCGRIAPSDIAGVCERARELLEHIDADPVVCDVGSLVDPDAVAVDALARLQLTAKRLGRRVQLRHASRELQEVVVLMGLRDVVPCWPTPPVEGASRKAGRG